MNTLSRKLLLGILCVSTALLGACVPTRWTDAPEVTGQVVSRRTSQPVAGASVSMTAGKAFVQTRTDGSGSFRLPALKHWDLLWLLEVDQLSNGTLRVEASGYRPFVSHEGDVPALHDAARAPGITYLPTHRDDFERVHIALTPGA